MYLNSYKINSLAFLILCSQIFFSCRIQRPVNPGFGGAFQSPSTSAPTHVSENQNIEKDTNSNQLTAAPVANAEKAPEFIPNQTVQTAAVTGGSKLKPVAKAVLQKLKPKHSFKRIMQKAKSSGGGGGGVALIAVGLLLFLLLRKVIGLSAGWSWGIVIFIVFTILIVMAVGNL